MWKNNQEKVCVSDLFLFLSVSLILYIESKSKKKGEIKYIHWIDSKKIEGDLYE